MTSIGALSVAEAAVSAQGAQKQTKASVKRKDRREERRRRHSEASLNQKRIQMSYLLKDPDTVLDYLVDWGAEYLASDELLTSDWSVDRFGRLTYPQHASDEGVAAQ